MAEVVVEPTGRSGYPSEISQDNQISLQRLIQGAAPWNPALTKRECKGRLWAAAACYYAALTVCCTFSSIESKPSGPRLCSFFLCCVFMFHMRLCREVSHRWFRSAVVKPTLRAEGNRAAEGHDVCCYCMRVHFYTALITDCEHRQTCLFCCVVYTEAWLAPQTHVPHTHTHTLLCSSKSIYPGQRSRLYLPVEWVTCI